MNMWRNGVFVGLLVIVLFNLGFGVFPFIAPDANAQTPTPTPECMEGQILCPYSHPDYPDVPARDVCCWGDGCDAVGCDEIEGILECHCAAATPTPTPLPTPTPTPTPTPCESEPPVIQLHAPDSIEACSPGQVRVSGIPGGVQVTWSPIRMFPKAGEMIIIDDDFDESTGILAVNPHSGSGRITLTATYTGDNCCPDVECTVSDTVEIEIQGIACFSCSGIVCGVPGMGSIALELTLGTTASGRTAGRLFLNSDAMLPDLATPAMLFYDGASDEVEVIESSPDVLRQVLAPQVLADIVVLDDFSYDIRFYASADAGTKGTSGLYEPTGDPFLVWTIENPDASPTTYNRLRLTKTEGTESTVYEYDWDETTQTWALSSGNGLNVETKQELRLSASDRLEIRVLKNASEEIASKTATTYRTFDWGEDVIEEVIDPDDAALTTTTTYYETLGQPGYGRVHTITSPDGSQVEYIYNADDTVQEVREHWKDTSNGKVTLYDYTPVDPSDDGSTRPKAARTIIEQVGGLTIANTYRAYFGDTEIVEQAADPTAAYGDPANQRTTTTYYPESGPEVEAGKIQQMTSPDGRTTSYTYEQGTLTIGSVSDPDTYVFTPGTGTARRTIVTQGPATSGNTTRQISLTNNEGYQVLTETQIYTGSGYERIQWTISEHNQLGQVIHTSHSDGTETDAQWGCCGKTWEQDSRGTERSFFYDDLNRLETSLKIGTPDISTSYTYDAANRRLSQTTTAGSLSLSSSSIYDNAGRIIERTDAADLTTTYDYADGGRTTTITRPGGATEISERYLDRRLKSITGTGVVARYYDYGVNTDGTQWTIVYTGPNGTSSPMWVKTTTDLLGQTISEERPGYTGATLITTMFYNNTGHLIRTENPGQADTLYDYDSLGDLIRSGLDLDDNGTLEDGTDRLSISNSSYQKDGDDWWQVSESGVPGETSISKTRLTGLGSSGTYGILTAESLSIDVFGKQTVSRSSIDRASKTVTRVTDDPFSTQDTISVTVNGLLMNSTTSTGLTYTYGYDALGRQTSVTDPRTGTSLTHYNTNGQVDWTEDAANNQTTYTYDPGTGRRIAVTNALGRTTRYDYDLKGQLVKVWGDTEPVDYGYDDYGRKTSMTTYRNGTGDTTTWVYEEATGLLLEKVYADGNKTTYTYTPEGQLLTRLWARGVDTIYSYDPASGDLTLIDYSDATPDVQFTQYDSRGRPQTIIDGLGTRTLSYAPGSALSTDSLTGVTRTYTDGHLTGLSLGSDYDVSYSYDSYGRFDTLTSQVAGTGAQTFTYGYLPDSDLLESLTTSHGLTVTRSYEPHRDIITQINNQFGTDVISQYDYVSDTLASRTSMTTSGLAFEPPEPNPLSEYTNTYTTNELNQYPEISRQEAGDSPQNVNLSYDLDGNLENDGKFMYTYDAENRLTSVTPLNPQDGDKKTEYAYDYMSRRIQKNVYEYDAGSWVLDMEKSFVYDGWNLIREETTEGSQTTTEYYVWGFDLSGTLQGAGGIGGLLTKTNSLTSKIYLYTFDANGNVGQLVDTTDGSLAAAYEYDPFGKLLISTGTEADSNVFRFSTKYYDVEVGLYYYGYRYYSPNLGRWTTRDPIGEEGELNLYGFVWNNPMNLVDRYGLQASDDSQPEKDVWEYTMKGSCRIEILAGLYSETPDRIKVPDCAGATINCCFSHGGVDDMNDDDPENDVERAPKEFDPEAFPGSQFRVSPYHERMDPETLIRRTKADIRAAEVYAEHLCESCCDQCTEIIIAVVCFGELASPPPTPTPTEGWPEPGPIYIGSAYDAVCIEQPDPYPCP